MHVAHRLDSMSVADLPDPRVWPDSSEASVASARLHALARTAIDACTAREADSAQAEAIPALQRIIVATGGRGLAAALATAPSSAVARHLWRLLADLERGEPERATALRTTLVALPLILVSALEAREGHVTLSGVLPEPRALEALLRDARAFGGAQTFALSSTLVGADALDVAALPALLTRGTLDPAGGEHAMRPLDLAPAPIDAPAGNERIHLRFIVGAVLAAPGVDLPEETAIARWGMPFAQALARQMRTPGLSLLALPRPPRRLVPALQAGRAVQREVSAQVFASNAIRKLRASVGEPTAIISAHRAVDAPGGGELRLSLSSPFAPRAAEGFRCPLYPYEPVGDVATMLVGLLRDCRVPDVRIRTGVHADVDPATGGPLLFKDAGPSSASPLH